MCHLCHQKKKNKYQIRSHLYKMHKNEKGYWFKDVPNHMLNFFCPDCSDQFISKSCLDLHTAAAHMTLINNTQCHLCLKTIKGKQMKTHIRKAHRKDSQYWFKEVPHDQLKVPCLDCSNRFVSETCLYLHKTASHEKRIERSECHLCYKVVRFMAEL